MPEFDMEKFINGLHDYIGKALAPLASRLSTLETRLPEKGEKGDPGEVGQPGKDGADGINGKDGPAGRDAPTADEIALLFERRFSDQLISMEQRFTESTQKAIAAIPVPKDGRDALEIEDFDLALADDGRTVTVSLKRGETVVQKSIVLPTIQYQGVYEPDGKYLKGDFLTYGGSLWATLKDDPVGSPGSSNDFQLAAKKGRDGKDLRPNASSHDPSKGVSIK